jgi:hypothetical protein
MPRNPDGHRSFRPLGANLSMAPPTVVSGGGIAGWSGVFMAAKFGRSKASDFERVLQPHGPDAATHSRVLKTPPISSPWPTILLIILVGVSGFVGLLVSSHYFPTLANLLRVTALVWFFGFGLIQSTFIRRQR